ncbi:MAG: tetratricopeptide repeat protein [Geobacteraceae bacterium]|nr:tetratricopeptide repeat protein [Geobacteraceae bacterium]
MTAKVVARLHASEIRCCRWIAGFASFALMSLLLIILANGVAAGETKSNRLSRMEIKSGANFTRLVFVLEKPVRYTICHLPDSRIRVSLNDTRGLALKRYRAFADTRISALQLSDRGDRLLVTFRVKDGFGRVRVPGDASTNVLIVDVCGIVPHGNDLSMPADRDSIWNGAGKLIREFDPPLKSDIPFFPTEGTLIRKMLSEDDVRLFLRAEEALYKERATEAEEIFSTFLNRGGAVRAIAAYRLGEAQYLLQKYDAALKSFKEGESLWPDYLLQSPSIVFSYADTLARCGEFERGHRMLERLVVAMADTKYGPLLLVRLGDILARGGREMDARAVYRNVKNGFQSGRAGLLASMRLADRELFAVTSYTYRKLSDEYRRIYSAASDPGLKDEALFKWVLIEAMYGPVEAGVRAVAEYKVKFPAGLFANVARTMHEDLLLSRYHELDKAGDCDGLVRLALDNRASLARCLGEKEFIPKIASCLEKKGMIREELSLFSSMVETEWAGENGAFLNYRIVEDAWSIGDLAMAAGSAKNFLARYSSSAMAWKVRERLGWIQYRNGDLASAYDTLIPLLSANGAAPERETLYCLGKVCEQRQDLARAEKAMALFLAASGKAGGSSTVADARLVIASARVARKDLKGAFAVYRAGQEASSGEQREMFTYKVGEVLRLMGRDEEARSHWQQLVREGKDPVWKRLAQNGLSDLDWRANFGKPGTSK